MRFDFDEPVDRRGSWSARWDRHDGQDVIPLWVADTDFRAPPALLAAMRARIGHGVLGYTRIPGELPEAVAQRMQRLYGWRVEPSWVVVLPGVVPGLHLCVRHLTSAHQHVLLPRPVYYHFERAARAAPRRFDAVPMTLDHGRWVLEEAHLAALLQPGSRLLMLCNPHNPGGTVFTRHELARLAEFALRNDLVICSDEIHAELVLDPGKRHVPIASLSPEISRRVVTLLAPNKAFNVPGAGCAVAIIEDPGLRRSFSLELHGALPEVGVFGLIAAMCAYSGACDDWLDAQRQYLRMNRDRVEAAVAVCGGVSLAHVEATYLAWIDARGLGLADPAAHFLSRGLALSGGEQFGAPGFVRLNFGTQRARLDEALVRFRKATRELPRQGR